MLAVDPFLTAKLVSVKTHFQLFVSYGFASHTQTHTQIQISSLLVTFEVIWTFCSFILMPSFTSRCVWAELLFFADQVADERRKWVHNQNPTKRRLSLHCRGRGGSSRNPRGPPPTQTRTFAATAGSVSIPNLARCSSSPEQKDTFGHWRIQKTHREEDQEEAVQFGGHSLCRKLPRERAQLTRVDDLFLPVVHFCRLLSVLYDVNY